MKNLVFILLLFFLPIVRSQNLITNPSFEDIDSCYGQPAGIGFDVFEWSGCVGWSCPTNASSDLWCENPLFGTLTPPFIPGVGYQVPLTGNNYAGFLSFELTNQNYREYVQNKLISPLEVNQYYQFSFYISTNEDSINYSSCIQAYFSLNPTFSSSYYSLPLNPQWKNNSQNYIIDTLNWYLVTGVFKANGGENFVTIGCFDDSTNMIMFDKDPNTTSDLYYFIDDISLIKAPIEISFPNIFTPNNDDVNDKFEPKLIGIKDYQVLIYNRWGNKVAKLDINTPFWDGDKAPDGVYYYVLESKELEINEQGYFQLIR